MNFHFQGFLLIVLTLLAGCEANIGDRFQSRPNAFGKAGSLAVLADDAVWSGKPGDSLRFYYGAAFPILPQPEPLIDLQHKSWDDLVQHPANKNLRAYLVLADLSDQDSEITSMVIDDLGEERIEKGMKEDGFLMQSGQNKWAENQLLLYLVAKDQAAMTQGIKVGLPVFSKRLFEFDKIQYEANLFLGGENNELSSLIRSSYQIEMRIPDKYQLGIQEQPFLWLQDVKSKVVSGLIFYEIQYTDRNQFSEESMITLRDSLTGKYIESSTEGSYMVINRSDLPTFYYTRELNGKYATELRGIWEMENEFMGGAFVTFFIHHPKRNTVMLVDGYVYGPGEQKREPLKQLIYLIENIRFLDQ